MYVTIDPGLVTGWAIWNLSGLAACGLGDPRTSERHVVVPRVEGGDQIHDVWIEAPVIYPRSKARPADITKLSRESGEWAGLYKVLGVEPHYIEPAAWKGQLPKSVCHARAWDVLRESERAIVTAAVRGMAPSKRHNVLDAVAMGLWVSKRAFR